MHQEKEKKLSDSIFIHSKKKKSTPNFIWWGWKTITI